MKRWLKNNKILIICVLLLPILYSCNTSSPKDTSFNSAYYDANEISFLYDLTYQKSGNVIHEQRILSEELVMIEEAENFIIMDMFLFNDTYNKKKATYPDSTGILTQALIDKKQENPEMPILFITDPINGFYGAYEEENFQKLKENGITTVITDLNQLKDSNFLYSGYYRVFVQWFGTGGAGWIPNPLEKEAPKIHIRSLLRLANFKANHRKILLTDKGGFVTSGNPHNPSSYHSNVAVRFESDIIQEMIEGELAVADFSGVTFPPVTYPKKEKATSLSGIKMKYITEKEIYHCVLENIKQTQQGDTIQIGMFYISDFDIIEELKNAAQRGVAIQIVADPNKDAFGMKKNGSPNRPVLTELKKQEETIQIRWYQTSGEQYHSKLAYFTFPEKCVTILGSGNYTRKNIKGFNLEADVEVVTEKDTPFSQEVAAYFDRIWNNQEGEYTVDFEVYEDNSKIKYWIYFVQEWTGMGTY